MGTLLTHTIETINPSELVSRAEQFDVLCVWAAALSPYLADLISWTRAQPSRLCILVEEDAFLHIEQLDIAQDPQFRIIGACPDNGIPLHQIAWETVGLRVGYGTAQQEICPSAHRFFSQLEQVRSDVNLLAAEYQDLGVAVSRNLWSNLSLLPRSLWGSAMEGGCQGMSAVICGAGPSLEQALPWLKEAQEHLLIIAGGSAVNILQSHQIRPHLIAGVDPEPDSARYLAQHNFETPFFYQGRFDAQLLARHQGPLIWMPSHSLLPLESALLSDLGLCAEPFDAGWTVTTFAIALAIHLGCSHVLLAGADFVCTQTQVYAAGLPPTQRKEGWIPLQEGFVSKPDWLAAAEWTREFIASHPDVHWQQVTQLPSNLLQLPLTSPLKSHYQKEGDLASRLHALIAQTSLWGVSQESIYALQEQWQASLKRALSGCDTLLSHWQRTYPQSPMDTPSYLLLQHDWEQEKIYQHCIRPLWDLWSPSLLRTEPHPLAKQVHRLLFAKRVCETYLNLFSTSPLARTSS